MYFFRASSDNLFNFDRTLGIVNDTREIPIVCACVSHTGPFKCGNGCGQSAQLVVSTVPARFAQGCRRSTQQSRISLIAGSAQFRHLFVPVAINEIDVNPDSTPDSNGGAETEPQHTRQQVGTENDGNVDRDAERRRGRDEGLCGDGVCVCMCVCVCVCVCGGGGDGGGKTARDYSVLCVLANPTSGKG